MNYIGASLRIFRKFTLNANTEDFYKIICGLLQEPIVAYITKAKGVRTPQKPRPLIICDLNRDGNSF